MSNVDMCEHDWPGSGCKECQAEAMARKITAPSGTPAMPVKAYYHEWTDLEGVRTRSVGLEVRKEFTDAPLVLEADALARVACLEGEIAKRDEELAACRVAVENCELFRARIAELEAKYQRDVYGLNNEGDPIGGDPAGGYANDNAQLRSELAALKAQEPSDHVRALNDALTFGIGMIELNSDGKSEHVPAESIYAAPVSEAKAHGVVMPERQDDQYGDQDAIGWNACMDEVARLNAAHVQQASVPGGWRVERGYSPSGYVLHSPSGSMVRVCDSGGGGIETAFALFLKAMLAASPAAPAADAWIPVSERLPDSGSTVISYYLNSYGKGRTIRAQHVEAWTIEAEDVADVGTDCVEYSEQDDCYYLLQGWYECIDNLDEYYRVAVTEGPITHWMPLPAAHRAKGVV